MPDPRSRATRAQDALFWDDFTAGLDHDGPGARWRLRPVGDLPAGDGVVRTSPDGIVVVPTGRNRATGQPAFVEPSGSGGGTDILRWAAFVNHTASTGLLGFDIRSGQLLTVSTRMAARTFGHEGHPYGDVVSDLDGDMRMGAAAMIGIDVESGMVFDLVLTNRVVYALYERLPRPGADHGMFSFAVPVGERKPAQFHELAVSVADGVVRWLLDGVEVLAVDRIGHPVLDRTYLLRENEGRVESVSLRQLNVGISVFANGAWGQGVELTARHVGVSAASG